MMTLTPKPQASSSGTAPVSIRCRLRGELKYSLPRGEQSCGISLAPIPSREGIFRSPEKRKMRAESGRIRPDLPDASPSAAHQTQASQTTPAPTAPPAVPLRVWDLALLWCFALVLWCFLPEPLPTNDAPGGKAEQTHTSPSTFPTPR